MPRSSLSMLLPMNLAFGCTGTDTTVRIDGPEGVALELDPTALPDGVEWSDVSVEVVDVDPEVQALTPFVRLLPEGIQLASPARLELPITTAYRDDIDLLALARGDTALLTAAIGACQGAEAIRPCVVDYIASGGTLVSGQGTKLCLDPEGEAPEGFYDSSRIDAFVSEPAGREHLLQLGVVPASAGESPEQALADADANEATGPIQFDALVVEGNTAVLDVTWFTTRGVQLLEIDQDGNLIADVLEGTGDLDGDGVSNPSDWDDDGDRIADLVESVCDQDGDGAPAFQDTDRDGDGVEDGVADCPAEGCSCGYRFDAVRLLCVDRTLDSCNDDAFEGQAVEYELVVGTCPVGGLDADGATCVNDDGIDIHTYAAQGSDVAAFFCEVCQSGTVSPSTFCP